jgi:rhamnogalacturonyl hydrolase YesR
VSLNRQKVSTSQKIAALLQELEALDNKPRRELTDIERALVALILKMQSDEQIWVLEMIFNRYKC